MTLPQRIIDEARAVAQSVTPYEPQPGVISIIATALLAAEQRGRDEERERLPDAIDLYRLVKRLGLRKHSEIAKAIAAAIRTEKDKG